MSSDSDSDFVADNQLDYNTDSVEIAKAESIRNDIRLRTKMTDIVLQLFIKVNAYVLVAVAIAAAIDTWFIMQGLIKAEERLINAQVIMTLIGAATVQLGSVVFSISAYLFPKEN